MTLAAATAAEVNDLVDRARRAGADIVTHPAQQPWGYVGSFADSDGHVWMVRAESPHR